MALGRAPPPLDTQTDTNRVASHVDVFKVKLRNWLMVVLDKLSVGIMIKFALDAILSLVPFLHKSVNYKKVRPECWWYYW